MGWKSTKYISRNRALSLAQERLLLSTNDELGNTLESLGFGDNTDLAYYGYNFIVRDEDPNEDPNEEE
jgi:hypothetical protein